MAEPWRHRCPQVPVKLVVRGGPPVAALRMVSQGASLLVIGRAEQGPPPVPLGPVADGVLPGAGRPVALPPPAVASTITAPTAWSARHRDDGGSVLTADG